MSPGSLAMQWNPMLGDLHGDNEYNSVDLT